MTWAGFAEAMERKRQKLGREVDFIIPATQSYAPDVALDPETGTPYDPFAAATEDAPAQEVSVLTTVARAVLGGSNEDDAAATPLGIIGSDRAALILPEAEYAAVAQATHVRMFTELYSITDWRPDGQGDRLRWIVYLKKA